MDLKNIDVKIWRRDVGKHRTEDDKEAYQADIFAVGSDHHGLGETASEALFNAAMHWYSYDRKHEPLHYRSYRNSSCSCDDCWKTGGGLVRRRG